MIAFLLPLGITLAGILIGCAVARRASRVADQERELREMIRQTKERYQP